MQSGVAAKRRVVVGGRQADPRRVHRSGIPQDDQNGQLSCRSPEESRES